MKNNVLRARAHQLQCVLEVSTISLKLQHFDQPEIGQVAVKRGRGPLGGFLDRVNRKFDRNATGVADAFLDAYREIDMVAIARRQVAAGLCNTDDGLATVAQFFQRPEQKRYGCVMTTGRAYDAVAWNAAQR